MASPSATSPELRLEITGMHCAACVSRVERALQAVPGVRSAVVQLTTREASVRTDRPLSDPDLLVRAVRSAGYEANLIDRDRSPDALEESLRRESTAMFQRFLFAAILTLPVMILGMAHIEFPGSNLFQFLVTTLLLTTAGREFFVTGIPALLQGRAEMNSLIALGTGSAYLASVVATFFPGLWTGIGHHPHVYYEAACTISTFVLLGRWLEHRARGQASQAIRRLAGLQAKTAQVSRNGTFVDLPLAEITAGDLIRIRPGERIPVDGIVVSGESSLDESMLTGEPIPIFKSAGKPLTSGTLNLSGSLQFRATQVGEATVLQQIVRLVREAQGTKAPIARLADQISRYFVPQCPRPGGLDVPHVVVSGSLGRKLLLGHDRRRGGSDCGLSLRPRLGRPHGHDGRRRTGRRTRHPHPWRRSL
jgi:cation transport ATPase